MDPLILLCRLQGSARIFVAPPGLTSPLQIRPPTRSCSPARVIPSPGVGDAVLRCRNTLVFNLWILNVDRWGFVYVSATRSYRMIHPPPAVVFFRLRGGAAGWGPGRLCPPLERWWNDPGWMNEWIYTVYISIQLYSMYKYTVYISIQLHSMYTGKYTAIQYVYVMVYSMYKYTAIQYI